MATPIDVVVLKCSKDFPTLNRALFTTQKKKQNFGTLSNVSLLSGSRLKSASPNIWLTIFQTSSKSVHFRRSIAERVKAVLWAHRVNS